jgi:hypothetical protein
MISSRTRRPREDQPVGRGVLRMLAPSNGSGRDVDEHQQDMPLPTPRSVISSPSHMMTPCPAVM